jgi:hypothetical protein
MRVVVTAELTGGSNHDEDFYCARYVGEHTFRVSAGAANPNQVRPPAASVDTQMETRMPQSIQYRVKFTLKRNGKTVGSGQTTVEVRKGFTGA